jgi:hypothetical protein
LSASSGFGTVFDNRKATKKKDPKNNVRLQSPIDMKIL